MASRPSGLDSHVVPVVYHEGGFDYVLATAGTHLIPY